MDLSTPWGEIEVPSVFTAIFSTELLRKIENIEILAKFYQNIFIYFVELMGTTKFHDHERIVFDKQISAGTNFNIHSLCLVCFWLVMCFTLNVGYKEKV